MGLQRVEIEGVRLDNPDFPLVGSLGCMTEIVSHRNRAFVPNPAVCQTLLNRWPILKTT